MEHVVAIASGRISEVNHRSVVTVILLCNPCIVPVQIAFGIRSQKAHAAGTGVFNVRIQEMRCLAHACRAYHQAVHISGIHKGIELSCPLDAAKHQSLHFRQVLPLSPFFRFIGNLHIGFSDFFFCGKPGCPVLTVPYGPAFDSV